MTTFKAVIVFYHWARRRGWRCLGIGAIFVLLFLFSAFAGVLADRVSKRRITVSIKVVEVIVTSLAAVAFLMKSEYALYAVLFLMATHSALFAPSKYGIVPELVKQEQLSSANSQLESFTYLAIILGSSLAPHSAICIF
jgi:acyl-[acyl-carrier-protein]-phospholipid O-acyltransferase/long-chain-fatty-acid--[acyl-carrier-protein] ligase